MDCCGARSGRRTRCARCARTCASAANSYVTAAAQCNADDRPVGQRAQRHRCKTGQLIVRAIVAGERDGTAPSSGTAVARRTRPPLRQPAGQLARRTPVRPSLARHDILQGQIEACEARIDSELDGQAPGGAANEPSPARRARESVVRERLHRMLGADLTAIPTVGVETALTVAACRPSRFATAAHFCSWLGLAPGTRISGDKRLGGPSARQTNRVGRALRMAASTARQDHHRRRAPHGRQSGQGHRRSTGPADIRLLTRGEQYVERDLERRLLRRQARHFDLALVPAEQAA